MDLLRAQESPLTVRCRAPRPADRRWIAQLGARLLIRPEVG